MKKFKWSACILSLVLLLTACGQSTTTGNVEKGGKASELADSLTDDGQAPEDMSDAENNGGHYVRVGNRVYFRKYGPDALETSAMFGNFTDNWNANGDESEIVYHDLTSGEVKTAFRDTGYGGLFVADGQFYLQERINGESYVVRYGPDGATAETVRKGTLLGVTESGLLAIEQYDGENDAFYFYRDGKETVHYQFGAPMIYAGLSDSGLFLLRAEYKSETDAGEGSICTLWQLDPDTETPPLCLGTLPETEYVYSTEAGHFAEAGGQIGVVVGYYAGTGHFLNDLAAVTATPGVADSLSVIDVPESDTDGSEALPKWTVNESGELALTAHLPGEVRIGWEEENNGDLQVFDGGEWRTLAANFAPGRLDGSGYNQITQHSEYVNDTAYVTLANAYASPLDDIGWRSAYKLLDMTYLAISAQGERRELASVDYDTVLQGNAWFQQDMTTLLLQQNTFDADAWQSETPAAFLIPISPDAEWDDPDLILSQAVYAAPEGEAGYGGWPLPETEGEFLCLRLNRDGEVVFLTTKSPDALLTIDMGVSEAELADAVQIIDLAPRPGDEDTPWYWTRLTALEDGVTLLIERTPDEETLAEELAMMNGEFVPGSELFRRVMKRGESVGLYASLPWHAEIRASVMRNGTYGAYAFGEDNYLHEEPVNGRFAQKIIAGYPLPDDGGALEGTWLYRDPESGRHTAKVDFLEGVVGVGVGDNYRVLSSHTDRLHAEEWERPDLLCLTAEDPDTISALQGMSGSVGDYYVERFRTDGEDILRLIQTNNGDAALDMLIPHQAQWLTDIVLHRYAGTATPAAPLRNIVLTAEVVKADAARNVIWLREAEAVYEWDDATPVYRAKRDAVCRACPLASPELLGAFAESDPEYPMKAFRVTIDRDGLVTALDAVS